MDSNTRGATWRPASCVHVRVRLGVFMYALVSSRFEVASSAIISVLFTELIFSGSSVRSLGYVQEKSSAEDNKGHKPVHVRARGVRARGMT